MNKGSILMFFSLISLLLFSSCNVIGGSNGTGGILVSEGKKADARMEQIISAIKDKDSEALKSLFSEKALNEASNFDSEADLLFDFIQGDLEAWEVDSWSSGTSMGGGKKSLMIRFGIDIKTDKDAYNLFVIDYNTDTINPDNQGIYMLEVSKLSYSGEWESWQDRMRAGISIVE